MLWRSLCQYPELLGQNYVEHSRFVCYYSSPGYRIFILTTPDAELFVSLRLRLRPVPIDRHRSA